MTLSSRDEAILDFERSWWSQPGSKDAAIGQTFTMTPGEYVETLDRLIDSDHALTHDPLVVRRLRRMRDRRQAVRAHERAAGGDPI
jgi:hypothetical protein